MMQASAVAIAFMFVAIAAAVVVGANAADTSDNAFAEAYGSTDTQWGGRQYAYGVTDTLNGRIPGVVTAGMPVATGAISISDRNDCISECLDLVNDIIREIQKQNYVKVMEDAKEIYRLAGEIDYGQFNKLEELAEKTLDMDRFDRVAAQLPTIIRCFEEGDYAGAAEAYASIVVDLCILASEFKELSEKWNSSQEDWHYKALGVSGPAKAAHPDGRAVPVAYGPAI